MPPVLSAVLITGLWGGLLALERRAFLQAALSRPLPAAVGLSAMLGDLEAGLMVGLVFELFHLSGASMGGAHPDHETLPSVAGAALAAVLGQATGSFATPAIWAFAILLCAPLGAVGRVVEVRLDGRAARYFGRAVDAVASGGVERVAWQNLKAMWPHFVVYGAAAASAVVVATLLAAPFQALPLQATRGLAWSYPALGVVSAGMAISARGRGRLLVAATVAVLVAGVMFAMMGARAWT
jgi:PTS system mannose-specific IIC component